MNIYYINRPLSPDAAPLTTDIQLSVLPDTAQLLPGHPFFLPPHSPSFSARFAPALRISRLGKNISPRFSLRYVDAVLPSLRVIADGLPDALSGFDSSLITGNPLPLDFFPTHSLSINGEKSFSVPLSKAYIEQVVSFISRYFLLRTGDLIIPGYAEGSDIPLIIDHPVEISSSESTIMRVKIK